MPTSSARASRRSPHAGSTVVLMLALMSAILAYQLNASMLSPALVTMERELHAASASIALSQTIFFSVAALGSLFVPPLADRVGRSRVMGILLIAAAVGAVITALAPNVPVLLVGRLIMGISGPIVAMCIIVLRVETPDPRRYGTLLGILTSVNGGIAGVDAILGGWLASTFGFRSLFWVMAVVCAAAAVLVVIFIRDSVADVRPPMDWAGAFWMVICVGSLLTAINEVQKLAHANWLLVTGLIGVTIVAGITFWKVEHRKDDPLVPPKLARQRVTWALPLTTILTMTGVFAVLNGILPALAQNDDIGPGIGAGSVSWYTLTPYAIAGLVVGPIAGTFAGRIGFLPILRAGQLATCGGLVLCAIGTNHAVGPVIFGLSTLVGLTYQGLCNPMLNGISVLLSPRSSPGYLPGINSGGFNIGAGLSFAVLYGVLTSVSPTAGDAAAYTATFVSGAIIVGLAFLTGLLIPRPTYEGQPTTAQQIAH